MEPLDDCSRVPGRAGMIALPFFPGEKNVSALGGWQVAISRFSRTPYEAWKFVEFLTGAESQKEIALTTGRAPARAALYRDPEVLKRYPDFSFRSELFTIAKPRPRTPVYAPLSNVMQRYFSSAIAVPNSDIDQLARLAARDMDRVLDLLREAEPR